MAFWDKWFQTPCDECGNKFDKEELLEFEQRKMCHPCKDSLLEERRIKEEERAARARAEEEARQALLNRPVR